MDIEPQQLAEFLDVALAAAQLGGRELLAYRTRIHPQAKAPRDFVTEADRASQRAIHEHLLAAFPQHDFVGEEDAPDVRRPTGGADLCWYVDPLDGTTNYIHGFPYYCVSIALAYKQQPVVGVVWDPEGQREYRAVRGGGAFCNGKPMACSGRTAVSDALLVTSFPPNVRRSSPEVGCFLRILEACQSIRRTGSTALNLCHLAAGSLDGSWSRRVHAWDVAAGLLMVQEAGGTLSGWDGQPFDLRDPHFVAAGSDALHGALRQVLADA